MRTIFRDVEICGWMDGGVTTAVCFTEHAQTDHTGGVNSYFTWCFSAANAQKSQQRVQKSMWWGLAKLFFINEPITDVLIMINCQI